MEIATAHLITVQLTQEQAVTVHAALALANRVSRQHELHYLNLHESQRVGPATRAEAWKAFRTWERYENETAQVMQALKDSGAELPFSAWNRFPQV